MPRQIIIAEQHRIAAVFAEDQVQELIVASGTHQVGDVYLGVVENVLPSIDAAFVNIGNSERNGFIHVSDLGPLRMKRGTVPITELVTPQQRVLVQVMKEPTGNKGPRLTGYISLPGRYLVLMPWGGKGVNLSRRIEDHEERNRLKSLAILIKPSQMGLLVRTEAEGVSEEAIIDDLEQLKKQWEGIQQQENAARQPGLLSRDDDFIQRVLRDVYSNDVNRIVTDSPTGLKRVRQYLQSWSNGQMPPGVFVDAHREPTSILEYFRIHGVIRQALRPRVDLPSGGYIVIEPTEALTVIDVNSGSFTQSASSRETVLWTNCEAATEIARQLRLRNIAGVIVVDFIDMDSHRDQLQVLQHFDKALENDKSRPQVAQLSELGLVELTRKRQGQSIYEVFGRPCPTCEGLGILAHLPGSAHDQDLEPIDPGRTYMGAGPATATTEVGGGPILRDRNGRSQRPKSGRLGRRGGRPASRPEEEANGVLPPLLANYLPEEPEEKERERPSTKVEGRNRVALPEKNREATRPEAVPEARRERRVIAVEMTPIQQKVYSEMGLSPRLLLKDPLPVSREIAYTVVAPGSLPPSEVVPELLEAEIVAPDPIPAELTDLVPADPTASILEPPASVVEEVDVAIPSEPEPIVIPEKQSPAASRRRRGERSVPTEASS